MALAAGRRPGFGRGASLTATHIFGGAMNAELDALMHAWARWAVTRAENGLGFARVTKLGRMIEEGPTGAAIRSTAGSRPIPAASTEEAIERAVNLLPDELRQVVLAAYLGRGTVKQKARDLNIPEARFFDLRTHAHHFVAGALAAAGVFRVR